jgi:hypothetical protein
MKRKNYAICRGGGGGGGVYCLIPYCIRNYSALYAILCARRCFFRFFGFPRILLYPIGRKKSSTTQVKTAQRSCWKYRTPLYDAWRRSARAWDRCTIPKPAGPARGNGTKRSSCRIPRAPAFAVSLCAPVIIFGRYAAPTLAKVSGHYS